MKKLLKKLRSKCGETLVEAISAILIFTFSSIILLSMIASAGEMNKTASEADNAMRAELQIAEYQKKDEGNYRSGTVNIKCEGDTVSEQVNVTVFTAGDGKLYSFTK